MQPSELRFSANLQWTYEHLVMWFSHSFQSLMCFRLQGSKGNHHVYVVCMFKCLLSPHGKMAITIKNNKTNGDAYFSSA